MLPELLPVVADDHDHGAIQPTPVLQLLQKKTHLAINVGDSSVVERLDIGLLLRSEIGLQSLPVLFRESSLDPPPGKSGCKLIVVVGIMDLIGVEKQEIGSTSARLEPLHGLVDLVDPVGHPIRFEPLVETEPVVHLTATCDGPGAISRLPQSQGQGRAVAALVGEGVDTGEHALVRGLGPRSLGHGSGKSHTPLCQGIQVGTGGSGVAIAAEVIGSQSIQTHQDHVEILLGWQTLGCHPGCPPRRPGEALTGNREPQQDLSPPHSARDTWRSIQWPSCSVFTSSWKSTEGSTPSSSAVIT